MLEFFLGALGVIGLTVIALLALMGVSWVADKVFHL